MKIEKTMHCIASKTFPLKFYDYNGNECESMDDKNVLMTYAECTTQLKNYDKSEEYQILAVRITYEI